MSDSVQDIVWKGLGSITISVIFFLEFWEDDGEIRLEDERAWFLPWRRARTEIEQVFLAGENEA